MNVKILLIAVLLSTNVVSNGQEQHPAAPAATTTQAPTATATAPASPQAQAPADPTTAIMAPDPLAAGPLAASYVIGAGDQISVNVWKEGAVSGSYLVRPDGVITMPLLADIPAAGFTPVELAAQIRLRLLKFLQDPIVTVVVNAIHSKNIYLMGETNRKGAMELTPGMTILQALGAGGMTDNANVKKAYILRDENGVRKKIPIHYKEALKGNKQYDIPVKAGDTIVVP